VAPGCSHERARGGLGGAAGGAEMKFALSTLALPAGTHGAWLPTLAQLGLSGLEVVPHHTWRGRDPASLGPEAAVLARAARLAEVEIVGLHGLLDDAPEAGLFQGKEALQRAVERIVQLSSVCRDLGGRSLVLGGQRWRGELDEMTAWGELLQLLDRVLPQIEGHGTVLCIDPLAPERADFCQRANECRLLVDYVGHPALGFQLNSAVMVANGETGHAPFSVLRGRLDLFHAAEPDLLPITTSGRVDHTDFRRHLAAISFREWVVLHQRATADVAPDLEQAARRLTYHYRRRDNASLVQLVAAGAASCPTAH